jgi:predicted phosphodiesterase
VLTQVDHIIHGGDIGDPEIIIELRRIAPATAIRGNVDTGEWASEFAETEVMRLAGRLFYVLARPHSLQIGPVAEAHRCRCFRPLILPKIANVDGLLYVNPGSAGRRRFKLSITRASLEVTPDSLKPIIHDLEVG